MRAFKRGGGTGKAHGVLKLASSRRAERKSSVEGVAGGKRVDRLHLEGRHVAQRAALEPINALWPVGNGEKTGHMFGQALQAGAVVADTSRAVQGFRRRHHMGAELKQRIVRLGRLVEIDDG